MTVGEFLERATSEEITYWKAYSRIERESMEKNQLEARAQQNHARRRQRL